MGEAYKHDYSKQYKPFKNMVKCVTKLVNEDINSIFDDDQKIINHKTLKY